MNYFENPEFGNRIITLMAAVMLKERLTLQLTIGALLISGGIVLVSLS